MFSSINVQLQNLDVDILSVSYCCVYVYFAKRDLFVQKVSLYCSHNIILII